MTVMLATMILSLKIQTIIMMLATNSLQQDLFPVSDTLYYDPRPGQVVRNKRDSRFFPGNKPAGVRGITKTLLDFIQRRVNPLGFVVNDEGKPMEKDIFEDGYEQDIEYELESGSSGEDSGFFLEFDG